MPDKQPMQAMSTSHDGAHDGVADRPDKDGGVDAGGKSESDGGAYPNPHTGKKAPGGFGKFLGHGGQTEQGYYGGGQAGADVDGAHPTSTPPRVNLDHPVHSNGREAHLKVQSAKGVYHGRQSQYRDQQRQRHGRGGL